MALTLQDKACKAGEKGWFFVYELVIYDDIRVYKQEPVVQPGGFTYYKTYSDDYPRTVKLRLNLNDSDKSHKWQLGGTISTPPASTDLVQSPILFRQIFYPGGTPITVFRESGITFREIGGFAPESEKNASAQRSANSELLDYRFLYCPQEDEEEWQVGDCNCPDKTKQQPANQDSPNPSEWSDRSWVDSDAGARGHCLHEYASYKYVGKPQPQPPLPESEV